MDTATTTLPQTIRAARISVGLTATQLAARLGITENAVKYWESGHSRPHPLRLASVAKALKIEPEALSIHYRNAD